MTQLSNLQQTPNNATALIKFSVSIETLYDPYEAFILMTPADYMKYFCEGNETADAFECASNAWDGFEVWVAELSGEYSEDSGNIDVTRLESDSDILVGRITDDDDENTLWSALEDKAGIDDSNAFREEIREHVHEAFKNFKIHQTVSYTIPEDLVPTVKEFVESLLRQHNG